MLEADPDLTVDRELELEFEVLPVVREMALPVMERDPAVAVETVSHRLPEALEDLAALGKEIPGILRGLRR